MKKTVNLDMTEGKPLQLILLFSLPILFGNIFQQFYNIMDTAIVGHVLGDDALAAVGATTPFFGLITSFANGATNGFSLILARFYGAKDEDGMKKTIFLIYVLSALLCVFITCAALLGVEPLLRLLKTPVSIAGQSATYLRIIFGGLIVMMAYNMLSGILRAVGNSVMPLVFLVISSLLNVVLDFLFVKTFSMGVAGAAWATLLAQLISVLLCIGYIVTKCPGLQFSKKHMVFEGHLISDLLSTAFSMAMMLAVVSVGTVALQSAVNSLDKDIIAAHTAARKIDELFMIPLGTFSVAASTYASQNYGAGRLDRVKEGIFNIFAMGFIWSAIGILVVYTLGPLLVRILTGSQNTYIIESAVLYIRINFPFYFFLVPLLVLRSSLQGLNRKIIPIIGSGIELAGKFAVVAFLAPRMGYLGVCISEPVIWIVCMCLVLWDFVAHVLHGQLEVQVQE